MNKTATIKERLKRIAKTTAKGALIGGIAGAASANPLHNARDFVRASDEASYRNGYRDMQHGEATSLDNLSPNVRTNHVKSGDGGYKRGEYSDHDIENQKIDLKLLIARRQRHKDRNILDKAISARNGGALGGLIGGAIGAARQTHKEIKDSRMQKEAARSRIIINRPTNSNGTKTSYNRIVDQDAVKNHYEPNRHDYEGSKTPTNKIKTRGPLNKYLSNMSRLGDKDLHHGEEKTKAHYRQKAKLSRKNYGEEVMYNINMSPKKREESKKKREMAEINRQHNHSSGDIKKMEINRFEPQKLEVKKFEPMLNDSLKKEPPKSSNAEKPARFHDVATRDLSDKAKNDMHEMIGTGNERPHDQPSDSGPPKQKHESSYKPADKPRPISKGLSEYADEARVRSGESKQKEGLSRGQKIGLGVGAAGTLVGAIALRRYLKKRKAKKEAEMNKSASLFSGETRHDVNVGKETRDWIDAKGAKAGQALSKAKDYASSMKEKAAPYATNRNAQIGVAGLLGAYAVYKGGKALKGAIKNRMDERSARRKEDDRIKYYKGQMDTHKDNPHMLRALTSRMSKEKFDA